MWRERPVCVNCTEVTGSVFISCVDCPVAVDLCLCCFSCGAEPSGCIEGSSVGFGNHQPSHRYQVRNFGGPQLFGCPDGQIPPWSAAEELLLLQTVERAGNWASVRDCLNDKQILGDNLNDRSYTEEQIRRHYHDFYIDGRLGHTTLRNGTGHNDLAIDHTDSPVEVVEPAVVPAGLEELAYMPKRDEFERDWHDGVERLLNSQVVLPDDEDVDRLVRVSIVDIYRRSLMERNRRKSVSRRLNLMAAFLEAEKKTEISPKPKFRTFRQRLKFACRFMSVAEFDDLVKSLQAVKKLKRTVSCLQRYRQNGITGVQDANKFELESVKRTKLKVKFKTAAVPSTSDNRPSEDNSQVSAKPKRIRKKEKPQKHPEELMSAVEKTFCDRHRLQPATYLLLKIASLQEFDIKQRGRPIKKSYLSQYELDSKKVAVEKFLRDVGLILC